MERHDRLAHHVRKVQLARFAREAFLQGGYRGTTTKDIARAASVSEALVVKHFGTKEELFRYAVVNPLLDMIESALLRMHETAEPAHEDIRDQRENVRSFLLDWAETVRTEGPLLWAVLREAQNFPDIAESVATLFRSYVERLAQYMEMTTDRAEYRRFDPRVATYMSLAAATMSALLGDDPESFVAEAVDILFSGGLLTPAGREALKSAENRRDERARRAEPGR
jgi:AcrR family transcriptional regulator